MEEIAAEPDSLDLRMARLATQLNDPMYSELAIHPSEIEHEYREIAHPRMMGLEHEHASETIRQLLEVIGARVEIHEQGAPL